MIDRDDAMRSLAPLTKAGLEGLVVLRGGVAGHSLSPRVATALGHLVPDEGRTTLLVTDPRTRSRELALESLGWRSEEIHSVWIR
jgi:hypothetical protein